MKIGQYKVPYNINGGLMHFADPPSNFVSFYKAHEWRDNARFWARLKLDGMTRGRSAAYFIWKDSAGREFPMFMTDLVDLLNRSSVMDGSTDMNPWKIVKRGRNYGIVLDRDEMAEGNDRPATDSVEVRANDGGSE